MCLSFQSIAAGVELKQGVCSYGDLPGYWNPVANRTVGNWTLLDLECQLEVSASWLNSWAFLCLEGHCAHVVNLAVQDRLGHHLRAAKNSQTLSSDDVGILILGDSADRNLIFDMCIEAGQQVDN